MTTPVIAIARPKFSLGRTVITANAEATLNPDDVLQGLSRHASGDWGDLFPEEARSNAYGLEHGGRLMSAYGARPAILDHHRSGSLSHDRADAAGLLTHRAGSDARPH